MYQCTVDLSRSCVLRPSPKAHPKLRNLKHVSAASLAAKLVPVILFPASDPTSHWKAAPIRRLECIKFDFGFTGQLPMCEESMSDSILSHVAFSLNTKLHTALSTTNCVQFRTRSHCTHMTFIASPDKKHRRGSSVHLWTDSIGGRCTKAAVCSICPIPGKANNTGGYRAVVSICLNLGSRYERQSFIWFQRHFLDLLELFNPMCHESAMLLSHKMITCSEMASNLA